MSLWMSPQNEEENSLDPKWQQVHSIFHASFVSLLMRYLWLKDRNCQRPPEHPQTSLKPLKLVTKSSYIK